MVGRYLRFSFFHTIVSPHIRRMKSRKTVSCDAYSNISGSDLNASDFIWLLLDSRARTRRPKINDYILDETIVLHNIAFEFLCSQLSCKMRAHFFIRRHKRTNLWIYRILLQTFDIQMVAVAAGTWHEISEWMMSIHTANEKRNCLNCQWSVKVDRIAKYPNTISCYTLIASMRRVSGSRSIQMDCGQIHWN